MDKWICTGDELINTSNIDFIKFLKHDVTRTISVSVSVNDEERIILVVEQDAMTDSNFSKLYSDLKDEFKTLIAGSSTLLDLTALDF